MRHKVFLSAFVLMSMLPAAWAVTLELRADAEIDTPTYRLKDIATVKQDPSGELAEIPIGIAPRPNHVEYLTQAQITRIIESTTPTMRGKLEWTGSHAVAVRAQGVVVANEKLVTLAQSALQSELSQKFSRVELNAVGNIRKTTIPAQASLQVRPITGKASRRMAVWIDIQVDNRPYGSLPVWFDVKAWKRVPVAVHELGAGTVLKNEHFEYKEREVLTGQKFVEQIPENAIRLRTRLASGAVLTADALEKNTAISRNQEVAVRVAAGNIVIETSGVAQTDGQVGQTVKVKPSGSSEFFMAKVLEPGVVLVDAR